MTLTFRQKTMANNLDNLRLIANYRYIEGIMH